MSFNPKNTKSNSLENIEKYKKIIRELQGKNKNLIEKN